MLKKKRGSVGRQRSTAALKYPSEQMLRAAPKGIMEIIKSTSCRNGFLSAELYPHWLENGIWTKKGAVERKGEKKKKTHILVRMCFAHLHTKYIN